jgi:hypothetical protein
MECCNSITFMGGINCLSRNDPKLTDHITCKSKNINNMFTSFKYCHVITTDTSICTLINELFFPNGNIMLTNTLRNTCHVCQIILTLEINRLTLVQIVYHIPELKRAWSIIAFVCFAGSVLIWCVVGSKNLSDIARRFTGTATSQSCK